jgi:hypothetical protein
MPTMKTQHQTSRKIRRGGGIGMRVALVLALLLVARIGGPAGAAHDLVQFVDAALEVAHLVAGLTAAAAVAALVIRVVRLCWSERHVHVITDAAWPRGTRMAGGR